MEKRHWNDAGAEARQMGGRPAAAGSTVETFGVHFRSGNPGKSQKTPSEKTWKNGHPKTWKCMLKRCQNGVEMYAKTHQKSMQKLVTGNIRKIMKNHVFPMCKTMQNHHTVIKKRGLARWVCGSGKSWKNMKIDVKIRFKIDEKLIRKRCSKNNAKMMETGAKMEPESGTKSRKMWKNECQKRCLNSTPKSDTMRDNAGEGGGSLLLRLTDNIHRQ